MFQPFVPFERKYLAKLINLRRHYFVIQSYNRAPKEVDGQEYINLLVSEYSDPGLAIGHLRAVRHDQNACILNVKRDSDLMIFQAILSNNKDVDTISHSMHQIKHVALDGQMPMPQRDDKRELDVNSSRKFKVFLSVVLQNKDLKDKLKARYKDQIKHFIDNKFSWNLTAKDTVNVILKDVEVTYGEIFVIFKWQEQTERIKFEEIEQS